MALQRKRRILFTGGRDFDKHSFVEKVFVSLEPDIVIVGDATGLDRIVVTIAKVYCVPTLQCFAEWNRHGKRAGILRNQQMIEVGEPTLGAVFPGGRGTADMVQRLKVNKIPFQFHTPV
jgi:hypothetical protein